MLLLGLVVAVVAAGGAVASFQPQKLFIDQRVDEALPGQVAPSEGPARLDDLATSNGPDLFAAELDLVR